MPAPKKNPTEVGINLAIMHDTETPVPAEPFADGIYFGLDEQAYHDDLALGSTDKKSLLTGETTYWWNSPLNPMREEKEETPAIIRGHAVHKFVLEGDLAFKRIYGRCEYKGTIKAGIAEREDFKGRGMVPLAGKLYDRVILAGSIIRLNPHVADAFSGGQSEVSVFWTENVDGMEVRQKARFDNLKVRAIVDLKTHDPREDLGFIPSCMKAIKDRNMPLQAQSYLIGRQHVARFVADGAVYGDHDSAWLKRVAASTESAFVYCFWSSKGAPLTWGGYFSPGNRKLQEAQVDIDRALKRYVAAVREFGPDTAWIRPIELNEIDADDVDNWYRLVGQD